MRIVFTTYENTPVGKRNRKPRRTKNKKGRIEKSCLFVSSLVNRKVGDIGNVAALIVLDVSVVIGKNEVVYLIVGYLFCSA